MVLPKWQASPCYDVAMAANAEAFRAALERDAQTFSVAFDRGQAEAIHRYASLLLTWTARINLTGAVSLDDLAAQHLPDSFALAARVGAEVVTGIDVGSGGGLPALPLALLCPGLTLHLLEPIAKKAAFLRTAIRELGLGGRVTVDTWRVQTMLPAAFDVAMSRATFPPPVWVPIATELVRPGGRMFVLASAGADDATVDALSGATSERGLELVVRWPYLQGRRHLIELRRPV
jgi:16S rRNA (guanine527-N7)-methyltransferase